MAFPPNIDSRTFTLSAVILGYLLIDDFTVNEQNAISNWLLLVGQVLETNAAQQQLLNSRKAELASKNKIPFEINKESLLIEDLKLIKNAISKMQAEIDNLIKKK